MTAKPTRCACLKTTGHAGALPAPWGLAVGLLVVALVVAPGYSWGTVAHVAEIVTYPAPAGEALSAEYQVQMAGQNIDVYTARVLDPPFAGKQWDHGGSYSFADFDMSGPVVVRTVSKRSLRNVVIRPYSWGIQPTLEDDHTLNLTLDHPRKLCVQPDGKKGPREVH
jgi:hypothetical protein